MSDENLVLLLLGLMRHTISEIIETLGFAFERSLLLYLPMWVKAFQFSVCCPHTCHPVSSPGLFVWDSGDVGIELLVVIEDLHTQSPDVYFCRIKLIKI